MIQRAASPKQLRWKTHPMVGKTMLFCFSRFKLLTYNKAEKSEKCREEKQAEKAEKQKNDY